MKWKKYKIEYAHSSRDDMRVIKKYILHKFKYREYAENFTKKMKAVAETLKTLPTGILKMVVRVFLQSASQVKWFIFHLKKK